LKEVREDSGSVLHNASFERAQRAPAGPAALRNKSFLKHFTFGNRVEFLNFKMIFFSF
jgi:hypothetical protein